MYVIIGLAELKYIVSIEEPQCVRPVATAKFT